ncbi:MAG: hypothetical protein IPH56_05165 [Chitinophagaceae bacterium]|nr:hypothetical protein [Chitinophagaceae bacterium]
MGSLASLVIIEVNPISDNTGDRYTIEDSEGMPLPSFIGNIGWYAFLNGKYDKCIELSNKALSADSTLLFAKLNIALTKLKLKNSDYYSNTYLRYHVAIISKEGRNIRSRHQRHKRFNRKENS